MNGDPVQAVPRLVRERLNNSVEAGTHKLEDVCCDLHTVPEISSLLKARELEPSFVSATKVLVDDSRDFYMYVDDKNARLVACLKHIRESDPRIVYIDFLHELVHIFQLHDGKNLYDRRYKYVRRPTEIEAYEIAVNEGRRIGMTEAELLDYLKVEWISEEEHLELARKVGIGAGPASGPAGSAE